ncbi:hypothetical protein [Phaeobacter sp. JH209A]|uniref:hypothetical protein n=1 Tax=Phaeobacter sp. JH209A TaxID=3112505 RepID=UPI003A8A6F86
MGREIRRVPPNWDHPIVERGYGREGPQPMYDKTYQEACADWLADFDRVRSGGMESYERDCYENECHWASENVAPAPDYYRPWQSEEATWLQVWETVSEGTPVTPPFETQEELIQYLADHGDFWDQKRCQQPNWQTLWGGTPGVSGWGKSQAERFVRGPGWAPSMVVECGRVMSGVEAVTQES